MHIYDTTNSTSPIALKPEKLEKLENCQYTLRLRSFCKVYLFVLEVPVANFLLPGCTGCPSVREYFDTPLISGMG